MMNRIFTSVVLLIIGIVISFLTDNFIISILVCAVFGLLLNRGILLNRNVDNTDPSIKPSEFKKRFQALKDHVAVHDYDYHIYEDTVLDSVFIDTEGQFWCLGLESLDWYLQVGDRWERSSPNNKMVLVSEVESLEIKA